MAHNITINDTAELPRRAWHLQLAFERSQCWCRVPSGASLALCRSSSKIIVAPQWAYQAMCLPRSALVMSFATSSAQGTLCVLCGSASMNNIAVCAHWTLLAQDCPLRHVCADGTVVAHCLPRLELVLPKWARSAFFGARQRLIPARQAVNALCEVALVSTC